MTHLNWTVLLDGPVLPDRAAVGGKAWSIAWMRSLGLNVPPAFVVTTQACLAYLEHGVVPAELEEEITAGLAWLEAQTGRRFGDAQSPLLLSIRSGAAISMPGMMDTVLNLGINEATEQALAHETGRPEFARDTHRRFCELYAAIVLKLPALHLAPDAGPAVWRDQIGALGGSMPTDGRDQIRAAVLAVFDSWNTRRARRYREHNNIPHDLGTAVTIQAMVFGNLDEDSGTGVLFSRNPLTGERKPFGEYLPRAQGEDVVSGKFTPLPLEAMQERVAPALAELLAASECLEQAHRDMQDIEFTVQRGKLYLLQARSDKRSPAAAVVAAVDMVEEGIIDAGIALKRVTAEQVRTLLLPRLAEGANKDATMVATGEGACPGVAAGVAVGDTDEAERRAALGEAVILVRKITSPDDVHGMIAARGVITEQGGATSHAAVVSRALGRPCVVGIGEGASTALLGRKLTVDGATGRVYAGEMAVITPDEAADHRLSQLIVWARALTEIQVVTPAQAPVNVAFVDLDACDDPSIERLPQLLAGAAAAKGAILASPEAARIAIAQGVRLLITQPVLPALLTALEQPQ